MKFLFALLCVVVLRPINLTLAAGSSSVPVDTVAGHAHMVKVMSESMCAQLTNDHATNFATISTAEAMQLTQQLFVTAMKRDSVGFLAMVAKGSEQGITAQAVGQQLGHDVVIRLSKVCPVAMPLILRLSQTDQAKAAMADKIPAVSEVEKKALQPLTTRICAQLTAANAKNAFAKLSTTQRKDLFTKLMQEAFVVGRPQLLRHYTAAQLANPKKMEEIGQKMAALMLQQSDCAGYLLQMGADEMSK